MCACGQRKQAGTTSAQLGESVPQGSQEQQVAQQEQNQRVAEAAIANSRS